MIRLLTDYVQPTTTDPQLLDSGSVGGPLGAGCGQHRCPGHPAVGHDPAGGRHPVNTWPSGDSSAPHRAGVQHGGTVVVPSVAADERPLNTGPAFSVNSGRTAHPGSVSYTHLTLP